MKNILKIISAIFLINTSLLSVSMAQTHLVVSGNNLVTTGNFLVLENTNLTNNGTFHSDTGTVIITGDALDANATINGTSSTVFSRLWINKSANNALLGNHIFIKDSLVFQGGLLDISDYNISLSDTAAFNGATASTYIKTSSIGTISRKVGTSYVDFPVGDNAYSPISVNNTGDADTFNVRAESAVYEDGTSGTVLTENAVNVSWHISENTISGSNANFIFQWYNSEELTNFDRTNSNVAIYANSDWTEGTNGAASGTNPYLKFANGVTNLGSFAIVSDGSALPVELLYFYGEKEGNNVLLSWETATELNNDYFDVEFSLDGISFEKIGEVQGAGTTIENQSYEFLHDLNRIGFENKHGLYYRLRQVDYDEKYEYTNIVMIELEAENISIINVFPNPATDFINIEINENQIGEVAQFFDIQGRILAEFQLEGLSSQYQVSNFPVGTYFIKIGKEVQKIVIVK